MNSGFGRHLLERGRLLFLLDGLDEVADVVARKEVSAWIQAAAKVRPDCTFVLTSRFAGYTDDCRLDSNFLELHIRPLSKEQAETFVRNWYSIVETGVAADEAQGELRARERADELVATLQGSDFRVASLFQMTRNPLLLANICLVHRDRGKLPRGRADLYDECIDVLLERWREAKGMSVGVGAKNGRRVLQPAAYWLHGAEGRTRATAEELEPVIEPSLQAIRWDGGSAAEFLRRIRDESGLLTGWDQERYGFMHLGFQEYLAAREIRRLAFEDRSVLRELARHHGESWWQEVALLLVALEEPSLFAPYLQEVAEQPAFAEQPAALDALLEDAAEVSDTPFLELVDRDPGTDEGLWARQLVALRVLDRLGSDELKALRDRLRDHPSAAIRQWLGEQQAVATREGVLSPRGDIELVQIPAGSFKMGSPKSERGRYDDEGPQHRVTVPAFAMGLYAVTNEEYARFLSARPDAKEPEYWSDRRYNQTRQPVIGVSLGGCASLRNLGGWASTDGG